MANKPNKWPGPVTNDVSVGDELAFDALPEATRMLAERVIRLRAGKDGDDGYDVGYEDGLERGKAKGELDRQELAADNDRLRLALGNIANGSNVTNVEDAASVAKAALAA